MKALCPKCNQKLWYDIGPLIFGEGKDMLQCYACGFRFNVKTGEKVTSFYHGGIITKIIYDELDVSEKAQILKRKINGT